MRTAELEFTTVDTASRVRQTQAYVEHGGFNRTTDGTYDPDPDSGDCCGYNDDVPYPLSQDVSYTNDTMENMASTSLRHGDTDDFNDETRGKRLRVALLLGSIVLFVAVVVLVVLSPF